MHHSEDDAPDDLIAEARAERRYLNQLTRHPDPRDPDHPDHAEDDMSQPLSLKLQICIVWEQLDDAIDHIRKDDHEAARELILDCMERLAAITRP
jgi:hypothetical protein